MGVRTENNVRVGVLRSWKVVWRFILERNVIISVGLVLFETQALFFFVPHRSFPFWWVVGGGRV